MNAETWLETYETASPLARLKHVETWLEAPDILAFGQQVFVMDNLFRILVHYNQLETLKSLYSKLKQRLPKVAFEVQGEVDQILFHEAIYLKDFETLNRLLTAWHEVGKTYPQVLLNMLETLFFIGENDRVHQFMQTFNTPDSPLPEEVSTLINQWYSEVAMLELAQNMPNLSDEAALVSLIQLQGMNAEEAEAVMSMMKMDDPGHLQRFQDTLSHEPHLAFFHLRLPFCRFMAAHGFHYLTATRLLEVVWQFWGRPEVVKNPSLALMTTFNRRDLENHLGEIFEQGGDLQIAVFLLWGLPWVYAFLKAYELGAASLEQSSNKITSQVRQSFLKNMGDILWTQAFIFYWSFPDAIPQSALDKAEALIHQSYRKVTPISDNPADSAELDALQEIGEEELFATAMAILNEEGPQALSAFLSDIEADLGAELRHILEIRIRAAQGAGA